MSAAYLIALAERVEAATGPDRELNLAISVAVNWKGVFGDPTVNYQWSTFCDEIDCHYPPTDGKPRKGYLDQAQFVPRWTASLDAAMTLVPEGSGWIAGYGMAGKDTVYGGAAIFSDYAGETEIAGADGATPAAALTAACLRALAAIEQADA